MLENDGYFSFKIIFQLGGKIYTMTALKLYVPIPANEKSTDLLERRKIIFMTVFFFAFQRRIIQESFVEIQNANKSHPPRKTNQTECD